VSQQNAGQMPQPANTLQARVGGGRLGAIDPAAIAKAEADLDAAKGSGDARRIADLEENLASRRSFLEMARRAADEFSR